MRKKKIITIFLSGLTVFLLILTLSARRNLSNHEVKVRRGNIYSIVAAKGKVETLKDVNLAPKTLGRLKEIRVKEGDFVSKDDVIAVLENEENKAQVEQSEANLLRAEAELKEAKQNWDRFNALFQRGIISGSELDSSRMKYDVALSQLKKAKADLKYSEALLENTYIRAPFSGKIIRKFLNPGETITLERLLPVVTIADLSKIIVRSEIDETDIGKVKIGQEAVITSDAYPGEEFKGKVVEISPVVGEKSILSDDPADMIDADILEVKIELYSGERLNLGLEVDVVILIHGKKDIPVLPLKAMEHVDGSYVVKVKQGDTYEEKKITTGSYDDENVEIIDGLREGDIVLLPNRH